MAEDDIIRSGHPAYAAIYDGWVAEKCPGSKVMVKGTAYVPIKDNDTVYFILIHKDDPTWFDPSDPTHQWHQAYGYLPKHEDTF